MDLYESGVEGKADNKLSLKTLRYIQQRGRIGRKYPDKVTILVANDSLDTIYLYASRRGTKKMRRIAKKVNRKLQPIIRKHMNPLQTR